MSNKSPDHDSTEVQFDDTGQTKIYSRWPRHGCVAITPGEDTQESKSLAPVVKEALDDPKINRLEVFSWPGDSYQEWILFPESYSIAEYQNDEIPDQDQTILSEWPDGSRDAPSATTTTADRTTSDPVRKALEDACEEALPDTLGYVPADIDFAPIERVVRPTCRLAVIQNPDLVPLTRRDPHPVTKLINTLNAQDLPYILQTIISDNGGKNHDYELSQRLVVYPPEYGIAVEQDFARFLDEGPEFNLSDFYNENLSMVRSNFDIDGSEYFAVEGEGPEATVRTRYKRGEQKAEVARRILLGKDECHKLYAGHHNTDADLETLYRYKSYYTKFPVSESVLSAFLKYVPASFTSPAWDRVNYAAQPKPIKHIAKETTPSVEVSSSDQSDQTYVTQGSEAHQFGESFVADYYRSRGFDVARPDTESSDSVPDLVMRKDDVIYYGEVERSGISRPSNVLTNAARAIYHDRPMYFFVEDRNAAESIAKILREPVKERTANGALLYTLSSALTLADGGKPLLPAGETTSKWYIENDQSDPETPARLVLQPDVDGGPIAEGPVTESVATWEYNTDVIPQGESVPDSRTRVHAGFVPTKLCYLRTPSIRYHRGDELARFGPDDYPTDWDYSDQEGKRKRYAAAYKRAVDQFLIEVEDAEVSKYEVFDVVNEEFYKPQTNWKVPDTKESGRALWQHVERKSRSGDADESGQEDFVRDHRWRYPRDVESPDLPFIGDGDDFDAESYFDQK